MEAEDGGAGRGDALVEAVDVLGDEGGVGAGLEGGDGVVGGVGLDGGEVAAELRECSQQEYGLQAEMREVSEALTTAEVEASQLRQRRDEGRAELQQLGTTLERELAVAERPLPDEEREQVEVKLQRVGRRREQIGPVNPLAEREYAEESEHVKDLATQRKDMEAALADAERRLDQAWRAADSLRRTVLPAAQEAAGFAREGYAAGKFSLLEVLDAQGALSDVREQINAALLEVQQRGLADAIDPGQYAGCYYPRFIADTTTLSNHSFGLALDLNTPGNQRGTVGEIDRDVVAIFKTWGFAWGGDWRWTDPMHFELAEVKRAG